MKEFRFPTIFGVAIIVFGLFGAIYLANSKTGGILRADLSYQPKKILISNFKPDQFTVSWQTEKETEGFIAYGESRDFGMIALDKRDLQAGNRGSFKNHYVTIYNLTQGATYYFKIGSKGVLFGGDYILSQNCQDYIPVLNHNPFRITLPVNTRQMARSIPASGLIATEENGKIPVPGVVACLSIKDVLPITDITSNTGSFIIPFFTVLKRDLTLLSQIPDETEEEIYAFGENGEITYAKVKALEDHPIPIMKLGGNYDFTKTTVPLTISPIISSSPSLSPSATIFPSLTAKPTVISTSAVTPAAFTSSELVELTFPTGQVADSMPTFRGKGKPGLVFDIIVESLETFKDTIKIDGNGFWTWTLPGNLSPGMHNVAISYRTDDGKMKTMEKSFVVVSPNPLLPAEAGTPSATLAPTATAIPTPTSTPTLIPTLIPTAIPTSTVELPPSGVSLPYFFLLTSAVLSIMLGIGMSFSFKKENS